MNCVPLARKSFCPGCVTKFTCGTSFYFLIKNQWFNMSMNKQTYSRATRDASTSQRRTAVSIETCDWTQTYVFATSTHYELYYSMKHTTAQITWCYKAPHSDCSSFAWDVCLLLNCSVERVRLNIIKKSMKNGISTIIFMLLTNAARLLLLWIYWW